MEKTVKKNIRYEGVVLRVREDEARVQSGQIVRRDVIEHSGAVAVALRTQEGKYFLVKQFRYAQQKDMIEFPAGKLEEGENPEEGGKREVAEEVGYSIKNVEYLGKMIPAGSYCQEVIHLYTGDVDQYVGQHLDEDEFVEVIRWSLDEIIEKIMNQEIEDAKTIAMAFMIKEKKR